MRSILASLLLLLALPARAATPHNDDSCDIAILPAATLLLPYFEVDLEPPGETTLFTITNVTNVDQVAKVTLWTDYAFPVISFDLYLTGYDVQAVNLYDVIARGIIAPPSGTGTDVSAKRGRYTHPNPARDLGACGRLPGTLDAASLERMQDAFTAGTIAGCGEVGNAHHNATGYATIDVVGSCGPLMPADAAYWTEAIRYDNVLIGDYQQMNGRFRVAGGGPMVHIRAVPEGGTPESRARLARYDAGFERTFYTAFQPPDTPRLDGRQPLPARFAGRWVRGAGPTGGGAYTSFKTWREGRGATDCGALRANALLELREIAVFDDNENATAFVDFRGDPPIPFVRTLPATSLSSVNDTTLYPRLTNGATSGWMYFNLDRDGAGAGAAQHWVAAATRDADGFAADVDAVALGNGCSLRARASELSNIGGGEIGPSPNRGARGGVASTDNDDSCDIALLPAATLLLPYFEVDLQDRRTATTVFSITNVGAEDRVARVTLWTDYAVPVLTFNVYLTGYDVQRIDLFDIFIHGATAATGQRVSPRGPYSDPNPTLGRGCDALPPQLDAEWIERLQDAFTLGGVMPLGDLPGCDEVGNVHDRAVGYATVDVVRNCAGTGPLEPEYWTRDIAYDNVLTGDYQQVSVHDRNAQGSPLVHVRAVPEGGTAAGREEGELASDFPRTFYSRLQARSTPRLDGRQPLPSTFATRWIQGTASAYQTTLKIWREGATGPRARCGEHDENSTPFAEIVRFDEQENAAVVSRICPTLPPCTRNFLPAASRTNVSDGSIYPVLTSGAPSGWMYLNLDSRGGRDASQNWVVTSMRALDHFSVDMDAAALGNGCSAPAAVSEVNATGGAVLGPAPNRRN